jgi:hypothetical protein
MLIRLLRTVVMNDTHSFGITLIVRSFYLKTSVSGLFISGITEAYHYLTRLGVLTYSSLE